jgi:hypothetical protein
MAFPEVYRTMLPDGQLFCRASGAMVVPDGSPHVRQIEFRLPRLRADAVVNATVVPVNSAGPGFLIFDLKVNLLGAETQVAISAQHVPGSREAKDLDLSQYDVRCHLMVTGVPVPQQREPRRRPGRK